MATTKKPTAINEVQWVYGTASGRAARHHYVRINPSKKQPLPVPCHELISQLQTYRRELLPLREDLHVQKLLGAILLILNEEGRL